MATFTSVTDIWTQGYDQFYRPCWQNKTREIYYESSGQVPAQHHQAILPPSFGMAQGRENCAVGNFTTAADTWTCGFDQFARPCWLNKKTRKLHYDSVEGQPPAQPPRRLFTPTGPSPQSDHFFLLAAASRVEDLPPPASLPFGLKAISVNEVEGRGKEESRRGGPVVSAAQRKGRGVLPNTMTCHWQYETLNCLKKSARGK